ncbi:hypothetical protein ZWY2020_002547 [Hordeum vulgare]|nr:hypothetical protein ZWY2020_002547 [Hordeum vulgare]
MSFLLGKWREEGDGTFPTIAPFRYGEEILFFHHLSKPVISYMQRTWKAASGDPMHAESGYLRPHPNVSVEVVIAQSTCLTEVEFGSSPSHDSPNDVIPLSSSSSLTRVFRVRNCFAPLYVNVESITRSSCGVSTKRK